MAARWPARPVLYPTVIVFCFFATLYSTSGVSIFAAARLLIVTALAMLLATVAFSAFFRDRDRGGLAAAGLAIAFLLGTEGHDAVPGMMVILIVVIESLYARSHPTRLPWRTITRVGNGVAVVLLLAVAIKATSDGLPERIAEDWRTEGPFRPTVAAPADPSSPDVYAILLDGYLRPDRLQSLFGHDSRPFLDALEARGFEVSDRSRSNYLATESSLASALNMRHLTELSERTVRDDIHIRRLIEANAVFDRFRAHGYETVSIASGFETVADRAVDRFIDTGEVNELERVAISKTAARPLLRLLAPDLLASQARSRVQGILEMAADEAERPGDRPRLVFAHVPSPHDPIVFDETGGPVSAEVQPRSADAGDVQTRSSFGAAYSGQVEHLNALSIAAIDRILASGGRDKVILLFSDHGSGSDLDWTDLEHSDLDERTADLIAIAMPDGSDPLGDDITLVNVFGRIIGTVLGDAIPAAPDTQYLSDGGLFDLRPFTVPD